MTWGKKPGSVTVVLDPATGKDLITFAKVMGMSRPGAIAFIVKKSALVRRALRIAKTAEPPLKLRDPLGEDVPKRILVIARRVQVKDPTHPIERQALKEWMLGDDDAELMLPAEEEEWTSANPALTPAASTLELPTPTATAAPTIPTSPTTSPTTPAAPSTVSSTPGTSADPTPASSAAEPSLSAPEPPPEPPKLLVRRDALAPDAPPWIRQIVGLFGEGIDVPPEAMATFRAWQRGEDVNPEGKLLIEEDEG